MWASTLHRAQTRKGSSVPYLSHLLAVSALVIEHGGDEDQAIAALLHDAMEDQDVTEAEIAARFGPAVAAAVTGLSDAFGGPKGPWEARKRTHIAKLREAPVTLRLVSAADKLHNGRAMVRDLRLQGPALWRHFNASPAQTVWYYRAMLEALSEGWSHPILDELREVVDALATTVDAQNTPAK